MSVYHILPSPDVAGKEETYAFWENGFSQSEVSAIINYGDNLVGQAAVVGNGVVSPIIRKSTVSWIEQNDQTMWLYDKLGYIIRQINGQYFQFDITGFAENFQYTVYNGKDSSFYDWHIDKGFNTGTGVAPRKLSMTIQLSDPSEYEGGELQLMTGSEGSGIFDENIRPLSKTLGVVHIFPSWVLHRVTPVIRGTRKSLVVWVCGPKFR